MNTTTKFEHKTYGMGIKITQEMIDDFTPMLYYDMVETEDGIRIPVKLLREELLPRYIHELG